MTKITYPNQEESPIVTTLQSHDIVPGNVGNIDDNLRAATMPAVTDSSISRESFDKALKTISFHRPEYTPEANKDYYSHPEAALSPDGQYDLAPLIYRWRDHQELRENQGLAEAIQIVTTHFRDHYLNRGKLEAFEKMIEPLASDAAQRLNQTETPGLPMIYRDDVQNFVKTLRKDPYYAIGFLAQSTVALADIRNGIGDNKGNIQIIQNYVVPYYRDRATPDQASLMLFALDQAIRENPMGYSQVAIDGLSAHRETLLNNTENRTNEEVTKITALRENLHYAERACAYIASQKFEGHPDFIRAGKVLAALNNIQTPETRTADLANPAKWLFGTSIKISNLATFLSVMGDLKTRAELTEDQASAFQALENFSNNVLSRWAGKGFSLDEAIADHQKKFDMMASAALLEETIEGLEGLQEAVQSSERGDLEGQQRLIDYIRAISRNQLKSSAPSVERPSCPQSTIEARLSEMLKKDVRSLVLLEKVIADQSLSLQENEALIGVYQEILDHYAVEKRFIIGLKALHAADAAPGLETIPGLESLPGFLITLGGAEIGAPKAIRKGDDVYGYEKWLLNESPGAERVMFFATMYGAVLQGLIEQDPSTPEAKNALKVLTYIQYYFEEGGKFEEFDDTINNKIKPILDSAEGQVDKEAFLSALTDVVEAGKLWREIEPSSDNSDSTSSPNIQLQMADCIATRYRVDDKAHLFKIAKENDEAQDPKVSVAILDDNYGLKGIRDLLPRIQKNPETALWDTARCLVELRSQRKKNPEMHRAAERIEAYIKSKFSETSVEDNLDTLVDAMHKAGEASYYFDANGLRARGLLDNLCHDDVDTGTLDAEKYALLILKIELQMVHDAQRKDAAETLSTFFSQAMGRFPEFLDEVNREKTRIQEIIDASRKVSFSNYPEFKDTDRLISALSYGDDILEYWLLIKNVIDDMDTGYISATPVERNAAGTFRNHVQRVIEVKRLDLDSESYQIHQRTSREIMAIKAIVKANLPEFTEIMSALRKPSITDCDSLFTVPTFVGNEAVFFEGSRGYYQESLPHLPEKVLVATELALSRRDYLNERLVNHLEVVRDGLRDYWPAKERSFGNDGIVNFGSLVQAFERVVNVLNDQRRVLENSL